MLGLKQWSVNDIYVGDDTTVLVIGCIRGDTVTATSQCINAIYVRVEVEFTPIWIPVGSIGITHILLTPLAIYIFTEMHMHDDERLDIIF